MADSGVTFRDLTTLKVGGTVSRVERPETHASCIANITECDVQKKTALVLGGGSNVLASDDPFNGVVIIPSFDSIRFEKKNERTVRVIADAGVMWDALVAAAVERDVWGLENLSSIPGTVGASPIQNIGAYGADVSATIEWVEVYDRTQKKVRTLPNVELQFGYRTSFLKNERDRFVVLRVSFLLSRVPKPNVHYTDLKTRFGEDPNPSLYAIRDAVIEIRNGKFPDRAMYGTAGSFFMNPILSQSVATEFLANHQTAPQYPDDSGGVKLSLAWILDHVVGAKGMRIGGAFVWDKQPLVIATDTHATATDVRALAKHLQEKVFETTRIAIVPEVTFL